MDLFDIQTKSHKAVSIVSLNCFLIPYLFTFKTHESALSRLDQYQRAQRIANFIADKEVIVLQEVWGSQVYTIQQSVSYSHEVIPGFESTNLFGYFANVFDSVKYWWYQTGGLWASYKKDIPLLYHDRHVFSVSETKSQKGVQTILLNMKSYWPDKYFLVFNTHLDPLHVENKRKQLQEIHNFMEYTINEIKTKPFYNDKFFENCSVILVGDFNIPSISSEYQKMFDIIKGRDLYKEYFTKFQKEEECTFDGGENSLIVHSYKARIDYIFSFDSFSLSNEEIKFMPLIVHDFKIATQPKGEELSDHWPLVIQVSPQQ